MTRRKTSFFISLPSSKLTISLILFTINISTKIDAENSISRFDLLVSKPHVFKETVLYSTEKKWRPQFLSFYYLHNGSTEKPKIVGFMQILRRLRNESLFNLHDSKFKGFSSTFALIKRIMEKVWMLSLRFLLTQWLKSAFPALSIYGNQVYRKTCVYQNCAHWQFHIKS